MFSKYKKLAENSEEEIYSSSKYLADKFQRFPVEDPTTSSHKSRFSPKQKALFGTFVGIVVFAAVVISLVLTTLEGDSLIGNEKRQVKDRRITLEDAVSSSKFRSQSFGVQWISDDEYTQSKDNALYIVNGSTNEKEKILTSEEMREYPSDKAFSEDRKFLLLERKRKQLYRHSYYADYYIKELKTKNSRYLKPPGYDYDKETQIRYCTWSTRGNALVLVYKNNIYYLPEAAPSDKRIYYQLTKDGVDKKLFNGIPDWVYEEEILNVGHAITFSDSGNHLAFGKFNASAVEFYKFPMYNDQAQAYTDIQKIAYPKAGCPNPTVNLVVVDLTPIHNKTEMPQATVNIRHVLLNPPKQLSKSDYYYVVMKFNREHVFVQWLNRFQNLTVCSLYMYDAIRSGYNVNGVEMENHTTPNGWIDDDYVSPNFAKNGSYYVTLLPNNQWRHLAIVYTERSIQKRGYVKFLTSGEYWIHDINCYDTEKEIVYFRSTEQSPRKRQVYAFDINRETKKCITCELNDPEEKVSNCSYWYPEFSTGCTWTTLVCQGPEYEYTSMLNTKTMNYTVKQANVDIQKTLTGYDLPKKVYYEVESDGFKIPVSETRPAKFNENEKHPILFDVYGGPNTQKITEKHEVGFPHYLVSHHNAILVEFDARGTGYNGYKFLHAIYRQLGSKEAIDCLAVAKHLANQKYVDKSRMAIWGWSYGGFYAATVLSSLKNNIIKTAVAVAPVTDWRYYDTVYSERYMGLPTKDDNLKGYKETSVMDKAANFKDKNFLLIHGTADDNVHFQNSAQLSKALIDIKIKFRQQYYPDKRHGIQTEHIWQLLAQYLIDHLTDGTEQHETHAVPYH